MAANGPIFLSLKDVTGQAGTAKAISDEFDEVFETLDHDVYARIVIGCTDTPSANVSAWKNLEASHPKQIWIGCMAHELSLLFKDWVQKVPAVHPSRFGFTKMYSEDQWQQFSSDIDQRQLNIQDLSDIRAAPTALLHALMSHDQWTLDK